MVKSGFECLACLLIVLVVLPLLFISWVAAVLFDVGEESLGIFSPLWRRKRPQERDR